jgi:ABC-type multidrug transport system fused ATPase/permease subunit
MSGPMRPAAGRPGFGGPRRGPMGGGFGGHGMMGAPAAKPRDFRRSIRRLMGELRPEASKIAAVMVFAIVGVILTVSGPKIMANATDQLFNGLMGKTLGQYLPAGTTQAQAETILRAQGQGQVADMLSGMHVTVGAAAQLHRQAVARRPAEPRHQRHRQRRAEPAADAEPDAHVGAVAHRHRDHDVHDLAAPRGRRAHDRAGVGVGHARDREAARPKFISQWKSTGCSTRRSRRRSPATRS